MCDLADCKHVYTPNKPATLTTEDQAAIWTGIKAARKDTEARVAFLGSLGHDAAMMAADSQMIKLEALTKGLWARFRVL